MPSRPLPSVGVALLSRGSDCFRVRRLASLGQLEDAKSDDVSSVLADVEAAAIAAGAAAEGARSAALNPLTQDVIAARRTMDAAAFRRDRLAEAARQLAQRVGRIEGARS
jgi:hypothetical protein